MAETFQDVSAALRKGGEVTNRADEIYRAVRVHQPDLTPLECDEQCAVFDWLQSVAQPQEPLVEFLIFHPLNSAWLGGSKRARQYQIVKAKAAGFKSGVADIICLIPRMGYTYLVVEMKRQSEKPKRDLTARGGVSDEQASFLAAAQKAGGFSRVCYGADEAIGVLTQYLGIKT